MMNFFATGDGNSCAKNDNGTTRIVQFSRHRSKCRGCGIHIQSGSVCPKCQAWDALIRAHEALDATKSDRT